MSAEILAHVLASRRTEWRAAHEEKQTLFQDIDSRVLTFRRGMEKD